jgi:indolepyruvate ferredoxin oxidoreductase, beta subunit
VSDRPVTLLIGALGGVGGGVLTDWIVTAATRSGLPVQSTSIPGVAQRTGATTYYIEVFPQTWRELAGRRPVLALAPGPGDVDVVVASEFLEAGRAVAGGFVTPDRTTVIASTHRSHAIAEKTAMGDGRFDTVKLHGAIAANTQAHLLFDMSAVAAKAGAMINAVMLGAIAASGRLPIAVEAFEAAIRRGKSADVNLRGFKAGLEAARSSPASGAAAAAKTAGPMSGGGIPAVLSLLQADRAIAAAAASPAGQGLDAEVAHFGAAADVVAEGVRRVAAWQDAAYARLYLDRVVRIDGADTRAGAQRRLTREVARHLALRMSYEDVIRVAEEKIAPERMARIARQVGAQPGEPVAIVEFLKPGIAEICSVLPAWMARPIVALAERLGWMDRFHWGMEIKTSSVTGYLRLLLVARLRRFRRTSYRFAQEQATIEAWLRHIEAAATKSATLALEIAECARLLKGYGDTLKRGAANYAAIERQVILPVLAGAIPLSQGTDAVASARVAALADPEGESLARCLAGIAQMRSPLHAASTSQ